MPRLHPARPPFAGADLVVVVPPVAPPGAALTDDEAELVRILPERIAAEADAFARELGAPVEVLAPDAAPPGVDTPRFVLGPSALQPRLAAEGRPPATQPTLWLDRDRRLLVADAPDLDGLLAAMAGLRSLARHPSGPLPVTHAGSLQEAIDRVALEIPDAWAGFHLGAARRSEPGAGPEAAAGTVARRDWPTLVERHAWRVVGASDASRAIEAMQAWLTPLGDFHTWVRPVHTQLVLPYLARAHGDDLVLAHVPAWTEGWARGVRPGWRLLGTGAAALARTTPGAPHQRPWLVARRALSGEAGAARAMEARGPGAQTVRWTEVFTPPTGPPAAWERLPSGVGYLWIGAFIPGFGVEDVIEEALSSLAPQTRELVVDLRGNAGGRLHLATSFRDRFLRERTRLGTLRRTVPGGALGPPEPLCGEPSAPGATRWEGRVRFLTDALTWSAAEDVLLGLAGLPHVQVVGARSGGGAGRLRRLPLLPGWRLTITTALAWDREGHCLEGRGIPVDRPVAVPRDPATGADLVLREAETAPWRPG